MNEVDSYNKEYSEQIPQIPEYFTMVENTHVRPTEIDHIDSGTLWLDRWRMDDGTEYDVMIGHPKKLSVDILAANNTPLAAQVIGRPKLEASKLMELGYRVAVIGPEIGTSLPLSHTVHNFQTILNKLDEKGDHEPRKVIITGESRGAMTAFGISQSNYRHNRHGVYYDITDPCYAEKINFTSPKAVLDSVLGLPNEIVCATKQMGHILLSGAEFATYTKTLDLSINGVLQLTRTGLPLLSGEAGALASGMPDDTMMHIRFFKSSIANHRNKYRQLLENKRGIVIEEQSGGHLSLLRPDTRNRQLGRMAALRDQLEAGTKSSDIDFTTVHLG